MRKLSSIFLALTLCLTSGCALYTERVSKQDPAVCVALPDALRATCSAAADAMIKGYVSLEAVNQTIRDNSASGAFPDVVAQGYLDKSIAARKNLDKAYNAFVAGNYSQSLSQANIVNTLLVALTAELAKRAAAESTQKGTK